MARRSCAFGGGRVVCRRASDAKPPRVVALCRLLLLAALPAQAQAGALLWPEGQGQVIVTTTFADAKVAFDSSGRRIAAPPYDKFEIQAYAEYGLTDSLTVTAEAGGVDFSQSPQSSFDSLAYPSHYRGAGISAVGARVPLGEFLGAFISFEAGLRGAPHGAQPYLDIESVVQADVRLQLFRGFEISGLPAFLDAQLALRARGQFGDEARADLTFGVRPCGELMFLAQSFSVVSPWPSSGGAVYAQKFELSAVYSVTPRLSLQLGFIDAPVGWNSPAERGVATAVWWRF
ncbi:MAG TPA: hypothetical protein VED87_03740 [Methylocystis sp.]|nr:hypothetical protein [Methylocystis sp.]